MPPTNVSASIRTLLGPLGISRSLRPTSRIAICGRVFSSSDGRFQRSLSKSTRRSSRRGLLERGDELVDGRLKVLAVTTHAHDPLAELRLLLPLVLRLEALPGGEALIGVRRVDVANKPECAGAGEGAGPRHEVPPRLDQRVPLAGLHDPATARVGLGHDD